MILASRGVIGFAVGMAMPAAQIYVRNDTQTGFRTYSLSLDNRALDNSSFLLIVQNLVRTERNGLSHSKIVLVNRSR